MTDLQLRIVDLEYTVNNYKKELRRIKTTIHRLGKLGLGTPNELLIKKENIEVELKERKQELKAFKKVAKLI